MDFSCSLQMSDRQNDRFARPCDSLRSSLTSMCTSWELFHRIFLEMNKFWNYAFKKFQCHLSQISLRYQTVIDQRLTVFHQLFSWTSVEPWKCPIDKMIGSQGCLTVSGVPWLPRVKAENSFTETFWHTNKFSN